MRTPLVELDAIDDPTAVADRETVLDRQQRVAALRRLAARYRFEAQRDRANRADLLAAAAAADRMGARLADSLVGRPQFTSS